jgi:hypothetical protein
MGDGKKARVCAHCTAPLYSPFGHYCPMCEARRCPACGAFADELHAAACSLSPEQRAVLQRAKPTPNVSEELWRERAKRWPPEGRELPCLKCGAPHTAMKPDDRMHAWCRPQRRTNNGRVRTLLLDDDPRLVYALLAAGVSCGRRTPIRRPRW